MHVFPQGLDNSLLIAVVVGVAVRFVFTETLGWVFSGLVVPGYLAGVAAVRPSAVGVIVVEALVTYALVRSVSWVLGAARLGTPVFGRDRFVWLVVTSVAVRLVVEGLLAPLLSGWALDARWDPTDGFGFYGIGVVLVPLVANALWKPGLTAGALQLFVVTLLTFGLIKLVGAVTNYSLAQLALSFDHVALDFASSPKAYLLLLGGLVLAARASLRFGWDTSGVLIPGLLTLGAFTPLRFVGALGEAVVVATLASLAVRLPGLRRWNIEGPRRVVFVFAFGFLLKFAGCWAAQAGSWRFEDGPWGLGYLLPSLLATRMWQRKDTFLVLMPALVLPAVALVVVSVAGFGLKLLPSPEADLAVDVAQAPSPCQDGTRWSSWPVRARLLTPAPPSRAAPDVREVDLRRYGALLETLRAHPGRACAQLLEERRVAAWLGLRVDRAVDDAGGAWTVVSEAGPDPLRLRGFGVALLADQAGPGGLVLGALDLHAAWDWPERLEPLARAVRAQGVVLLAHARGRPNALEAWHVAAAALGAEAVQVRAGPMRGLGGLAPAWVRARLAAVVGPLGPGELVEGGAVLSLDADALRRLAPRHRPPPTGLWPVRAAQVDGPEATTAEPPAARAAWADGPEATTAAHPETPGASAARADEPAASRETPAAPPSGTLVDDALTLAALERWLAAPDAATAPADAAALGLAIAQDAQGRWLVAGPGEGGGGAQARFDPALRAGVVEAAGSDLRLVAFAETLRRGLGLQWLLVAPASVASTPFAEAVRRRGATNGGLMVTVHPEKGAAVLSCVAPAGQDEDCARVASAAARAGVEPTRQPPYSPAAPGAPGRGGAFARAAGSTEVGLWVSPSALLGPAQLSAADAALWARAGFVTRHVSIAGELAARCPGVRAPVTVDWRPLRAFRQTHQAAALPAQARVLAQVGCPAELWVDEAEGLAFAVCAGGGALSLEALGEGRGDATARCTSGELAGALDWRPAHLEVQP